MTSATMSSPSTRTPPEVEGARCCPDLALVPEPIDGMVVVSPLDVSVVVVRQCAERGVHWAWLHRSFGDGSVSEAAVRGRHLPGGNLQRTVPEPEGPHTGEYEIGVGSSRFYRRPSGAAGVNDAPGALDLRRGSEATYDGWPGVLNEMAAAQGGIACP